MLIFVLGAIGCCALLAWHDWRWGVLVAILVGLLQDPIRKMLPGTPAYLTMASFPIWLTAAVCAVRQQRDSIGRFMAEFPALGRWGPRFALYLVIPAVLSLTYGAGTWQITVLGAAVYLTSFVLVLCGWAYPNSRHSAVWLVGFYALATSVMLTGGPLEQLGWATRLRMLGSESLGHIWVTHRTGRAVYMLAGFFRGPDIMGWHAATVCMVCMLLAHRSKGWMRGFWICLGMWGFMSLWICGRRKMIAMLPVFFGCYLWLGAPTYRVRRVVPLLCAGLIAAAAALYLIGRLYGDQQPVQEFYLTTLDEWGSQIRRHGWDSVVGTVEQAGFWGYGLGMSQQGIHKINAEKPRVWQESGPSKLFAELGVPGAILFLILGYVLLRTAYAVVRIQTEESSVVLYAGLLSIIIANLSSAIVSAQIYGDTSIASLLAFWMGLLLSGGRVANQVQGESVDVESGPAANE